MLKENWKKSEDYTNKVGYTATLVECGWVGEVVTGAFEHLGIRAGAVSSKRSKTLKNVEK